MDPQTSTTPDPNNNPIVTPTTSPPDQASPPAAPVVNQNSAGPAFVNPNVVQPPVQDTVVGPTVFSPTQDVTPAQPSSFAPPEGPPVTVPGPIVVGAADTPPVSSAGTPGVVTSLSPKVGKSRKKLTLIILIAVIVLGVGGAAAYYFGYYKNASFLYGQSLSDGNKVYATLMNYATAQTNADYKGVTGSGSYKFVSGSTSSDGTLSFLENANDSDTNVSVGLGVTRVNVELRTIKQQGETNPDIYLKASGITGLGSVLGSPALDQEVNQLNGQWIVIDHSLLDNLQSQLAKNQSLSTATLSEADVISELQAFGNVNKQYVFTSNSSKSVFTKLHTYGLETVDGHKVYHYKVGFNKTNLKQYITTQRDALKTSALGAWLAKNGETSAIDSTYNNLETSANSVNSTDTFDMWSDINTRVVYKVRISEQTNPATNFVDIGMNYNGGDTIPFFVNLQSNDGSDTTTGSFTATINSDTNSVAVSFNLQDESNGTPTTFTLNATFKPTSTAATIATPQNAEQLSQVLDQLGLGSLLDGALSSPSSTTSTSAAIDPTSISL